VSATLPDDVSEEEELDEELLSLLLLLPCLCFFLRAFLRASASCLRFSSSSLGVKRIHSGTSEGSKYLRFACAEQVSRQRCQGGARLPITSNDEAATAPC
jgi:hypothetical protein